MMSWTQLQKLDDEQALLQSHADESAVDVDNAASSEAQGLGQEHEEETVKLSQAKAVLCKKKRRYLRRVF